MSIRNRFRRGLLYLDKRLGLREWLRQDTSAGDELARPRPSDPFATSELQHPSPKSVLDIGGSHGQFAREAARYFPGVDIFSFEPIPECYDELLALRGQIPTLHPMKLALSDHVGDEQLWLSGFRDSSSLQKMLPAHLEAWPNTAIEGRITVRVARLDTVAPTLALVDPIFAKLDVQGHELAVIEGGRETLSRCQRVMIECNFAPLYEGQPAFNDLHQAMYSMGFLFDGFIGYLRHPSTLELLSADAIFYRPEKPAD
jgi:FkbM family methyltransferase